MTESQRIIKQDI